MLFFRTLLLFSPACAQTAREQDTNALNWFAYSGDHNIQGRRGIHAEVQFRRAALLLRPQQLLVRPAVNVDLTRWATASVGYAYSKTYPYGEAADPFAYPEHRIYEEITLRHEATGGKLSHRVRVEQRLISDAGTVPDGLETRWRYANRFRYSLEFQHPLASCWYYSASAEPQVRFGANYSGRAIDQVQTYAGIGTNVAATGAPNWVTAIRSGCPAGAACTRAITSSVSPSGRQPACRSSGVRVFRTGFDKPSRS